MNIDVITQFILTLAPAITSVIGIVAALAVGVNKIKKSNREAREEVRELTKEDILLKRELNELRKENKELKKELTDLFMHLKHVHFIDKE